MPFRYILARSVPGAIVFIQSSSGHPPQTSAIDEIKTDFSTCFGSAKTIRMANPNTLSRPKKLTAAYPKRIHHDSHAALNTRYTGRSPCDRAAGWAALHSAATCPNSDCADNPLQADQPLAPQLHRSSGPRREKSQGIAESHPGNNAQPKTNGHCCRFAA
jgi:hypothetical protein